MVRGKYIQGINNLQEIADLRKEIFQQELGYRALGALTDQDELAVHAVAYFEEQIVAMGRIIFDKERFLISHIAVKKEFRNQFYGDFVLKMLINKAVLSKANSVVALSLPEKTGFFETIGFEKEQKQYCLDGIVYEQLYLGADKLHSCSGCNL